jgi:UDP-N-acetylmuramoyl-tripeptide--D-alanyl-D-alanine ligase
MQMLNIDNIKIINDCYNSNPGSLVWALQFLREYRSRGKKIIVCGDMLELGRRAEILHSNMGKRIAKGEIDFLITVGPLSRNIAQGAHLAGMPRNSIRRYKNTTEAAKFLRGLTETGDVVLIKGSRAMQMENVVKCFTSSSIH